MIFSKKLFSTLKNTTYGTLLSFFSGLLHLLWYLNKKIVEAMLLDPDLVLIQSNGWSASQLAGQTSEINMAYFKI